MPFSIYILQSLKDGRYYVGQTRDLTKRIEEHNSKENVGYTAKYRPWKLVYHEDYNTRIEAIKREGEIKGKKKVKYIDKLILNYFG